MSSAINRICKSSVVIGCLVAMTLSQFSLAQQSVRADRLVRLPSGRQVRFVWEGTVETADHRKALMVKYVSPHSATARAALASEADDIWDLFRLDVERQRLNAAVIAPLFASQNDGKVSEGTPFVIVRSAEGVWRCPTDGRVAGGNAAKAAYYSAMAMIQKNQLNEALAQFSRSIDLDPKYAQAYADRGAVYLLLNQADKALSDFDEALTLNPDYPGIYSNRGIALMRLNQLDKALPDLTKALSLNPSNSQVLLDRGTCLEKLGRHADAIQDLTSAIRLHPEVPEAYKWRAIALHNLAEQDKKSLDCLLARSATSPAKSVSLEKNSATRSVAARSGASAH